MQISKPNIVAVERYAEALYYLDRNQQQWGNGLWQDLEPEDRNRYRMQALNLLNETATLVHNLGYEFDD